MKQCVRNFLAVLAALAMLASATSVEANGSRHVRQTYPRIFFVEQPTLHAPAPIRVRGPRVRSTITPYYFPYYPSHYSYNSPGPVFKRLFFAGPHESCWIWRYNYAVWTC